MGGEIETRGEAENELRRLLAWARAEAALYRTDDPVWGRAAAMIATDVENALRILIMPAP